jgi:hypothetical protein
MYAIRSTIILITHNISKKISLYIFLIFREAVAAIKERVCNKEKKLVCCDQVSSSNFLFNVYKPLADCSQSYEELFSPWISFVLQYHNCCLH